MKDKIKNAINSTLVIENKKSIDLAVEKIYMIIQSELISEIHLAAEDLILNNNQESFKRLEKIISNN